MSEKALTFVGKQEEDTTSLDETEEEARIADMSRGEESRGSSRVSPVTLVNGEISPPQSMVNSRMMGVSIGKRGRKTDREREEAGGRREWSDGEIAVLMSLWRDNDILYDTNHPLYYVQSERKLIMDYISKEMGINARDVNDKMHSLRTYYCSQRQRTESLDAKGCNSRSFPRWKFYDQMSFLYESVTTRAAKSSLSTTRRGRKPRDGQHNSQVSPDHSPSQIPTYTMMNMSSRGEGYSPTTLGSEHNSRTSERGYDERYEQQQQNGHPQRRGANSANITSTNYQVINSPGSSSEGGNPRKRHYSEEAWPETYKEPNTPHNKEGTAYKTLEVPLNTADEIFGHMVACSLAQIADDQQKELLKLDIQKLIYNTRFKTANGQ